VEPLKGSSLVEALALPPNIRLGWRGFPGTNTLAYYKNPYAAAVKSFIVQAPGGIYKTFYGYLYCFVCTTTYTIFVINKCTKIYTS
jgi:hypothetical protein